MLSMPWQQRKKSYKFLIVGSGYGGSIMAARLSAALQEPHSVCILERGKEWAVGTFPNDLPGILQNTRGDANPLGLYEFLNYRDISVIKGSGLGGTSLINANVALVPDEEVFERTGWPKGIKYQDMQQYYDRARAMLAAVPVPKAADLLKVKALEKRAVQLGKHAEALNLAVNQTIDGLNPHGVEQHPCNKCGDCVSGCNFHAKNTLYMNYLPFAAKNGTDIFTQVKVEWVEKLNGGGWRVHGKHYDDAKQESFTLDAQNVVLSAGSLNSTELLLRSEMHGLKVSPAVGTGFSGNGDFFGLAYNGDDPTDVLGYGNRAAKPNEAGPPGPSIVGVVRYNGNAPLEQRITVEDFSFPSAYVQAAKAVFAAIHGDPTKVGNEAQERQRIQNDFNLDPAAAYSRNGALNHTMLYLVMGQDNSRGTMNFDAPWFEPDGRMTIEWDGVGQQTVFTRMNEELRRHARALGASFISNPTWSVFNSGHLVTAHPLGGCPAGEDHLHGAVDQFGRVFAGDGSIHDGLFVADGSIVPSALGVNPFLTISALTERIAERKIHEMNGEAYPKPNPAVAVPISSLDVLSWDEAELEKLFRRSVTLPIAGVVNKAAAPQIDIAKQEVRNDVYWKGFFPKGFILTPLSAALFTGFKKKFWKDGNKYFGLTSSTDGQIPARNSLEEVTIDHQSGTLEPGKYILLRYLDAPWQGFYDIFKLINDDLMIGRVYMGDFPNGIRTFTFPMTRRYSFNEMTVADHEALFAAGTVPTKEDLNGVWRMDVVSNNNHLGSAAYLQFDLKPDGRMEARYHLMGLMEGLVVPSFVQDHFQLNDFTPFHDEIRKVDETFLVGRYITGQLPDVAALFRGRDLGVLHNPTGSKDFGFYYTLTRAGKELPTTLLLRPFLDAHLPDGIGLGFDETMEGWYFEGKKTAGPGRDADLTIAKLVPAAGDPQGGVPCSFTVRIQIRDINEFIDGLAHEAGLKGTISFASLQGEAGVTFPIDESASTFNYLIVNPKTAEAEMHYHIEFTSDKGKRYILEGKKYLQKDGPVGPGGAQELLYDYTTLYCHIYRSDGGALTELGVSLLKFRTFENLAALRNIATLLGSFSVSGTDNPQLKLQAQMRYIAFTAQFVQREYDPLALPVIH